LINSSVIPPSCPTPARTEDRLITGRCGTFRIRIHTPQGSGPFGCCLYFHGGGWVLGSIETHDELVRRLCVESGCVFVSVDYPLAPEFPYPTAIEDSYTALQWVVAHAAELRIDSARLAVAGDSAGANLAAVLCLMSRDRQGPRIAAQVLTYPITDCDFERASYRENAEGYFLSRKDMQWFWKYYVTSPEQMREPYASPLRAASHAGLPPAFVITAGYDPLCDEGLAYARALQDAGVPTTLREFPGMIHGFVKRWDSFDEAKVATREIGAYLRQIIGEGCS
jgi:acetyl esterase